LGASAFTPGAKGERTGTESRVLLCSPQDVVDELARSNKAAEWTSGPAGVDWKAVYLDEESVAFESDRANLNGSLCGFKAQKNAVLTDGGPSTRHLQAQRQRKSV
jgi:hypothetical protein